MFHLNLYHAKYKKEATMNIVFCEIKVSNPSTSSQTHTTNQYISSKATIPIYSKKAVLFVLHVSVLQLEKGILCRTCISSQWYTISKGYTILSLKGFKNSFLRKLSSSVNSVTLQFCKNFYLWKSTYEPWYYLYVHTLCCHFWNKATSELV